MDNIVRAMPLEDVSSFWLELNASKQYKQVIQGYGFVAKDFMDKNLTTYILWGKTSYNFNYLKGE